MPTLPRASVIIPCFNQAAYVRVAIDSALAQTYADVEVVVVDDGSTDDTPAVLASYGDRIRAVRQENAGLSAARNTAIAHATGACIVLLDSDDVLAPECVASRMAVMAADDRVGLVAGYYREIDADGHVLARIPEVRSLTSRPHLYQTVRRNWGPPVSWTIRRAALEQCGTFDPTLRSCEDWDVLIRISAQWQIAYDPQPLALYRQLPGSMSRNHLVMVDAGSEVLRKNARWAPSRLAYLWWAQFGRFQHGRRVLFNVLTTGPLSFRLSNLASLLVRRPHLLWVGAFAAVTLLAGKRASLPPEHAAAATRPESRAA